MAAAQSAQRAASPALTNSKIESEYRARTKRSAELYEEGRKVIPAGLTHDSRTLLPYPIYAARAAGPLKWDVDGNEYVDYFGGHGALLLGHVHPAVDDRLGTGNASFLAENARGDRNAATFVDGLGARGRNCVRRCCAGPAEEPVQSDRPEQSDAGFDL